MSSAAAMNSTTAMGRDTARAADRPRVLVLMPVWNGAPWLAEQLDSILAQKGVDVRLLCRDDGSTDDSPAVLRRYHGQYPDRVQLLEDDAGNLGASGGFSRLMQTALEGPLAEQPDCLVALADQDDVWHPQRLAATAEALRAEEAQHRRAGDSPAEALPVLVHADLRVVDGELCEVAPSLIRYQGLQPWRQGLPAQLLSNVVTGCTALMNAALLRRALPVPEQAVMHDWWLSLIATLYGCRVFVDRALVDYRQHGANAIGAREWTPPQRRGRLWQRAMDRSNQEAFEMIAAQAAALQARHGADLAGRDRLALWLIRCQPRWPAPLQKIMFRLLRRL